MDFQIIVEPLLDWYKANQRILPWRDDPAPYHVWVSEIMLQQTRVEAVKGYYARFMNRFPDIPSLAAAGEEELLKCWEGLGYYNRARNMQKAAVMIMESYGGRMPEEYEELLKLPGIGSYTAGAVASIAFHKKVPAVDGNVLRVISRVSADRSDISEEAVRKAYRDILIEVLPEGKAGIFNQALMDLGATVCIPNGQPLCESCPWKGFCKARREGLTGEIPYKAPKKARRIEEKTVLLVRFHEKLLLHKRPAKGLLAGMYEFPMMEGRCAPEEVLRHLKGLGFSALHIEPAEESRHIFSHVEWHMTAYKIRSDEVGDSKQGKRNLAAGAYCFVDHGMVEDNYPIPSAFAAYVPYIKTLF